MDEALSSLLATETASPPPLFAPPAAPAATRSKRVLGMVAAAALVVLGIVAVVAAATRDSPGSAGANTVPGTEPTVASSTTVVTASSTTVPTTAAPTTVPTTVPATTVAPTAAPTVAPPVGPTVVLNGPTQIAAGQQALWTVVSTNATAGTWSLDPPMQLNDASWSPDSAGFQGTFNPGVYTLTLTVVDDAGNTASNFITFTVT